MTKEERLSQRATYLPPLAEHANAAANLVLPLLHSLRMLACVEQRRQHHGLVARNAICCALMLLYWLPPLCGMTCAKSKLSSASV